MADLAGRRGALISEITRLRQQKGETRLQLNTLRDQRVSQAADGLRQMQTGMSEVLPRLTAARQTLDNTVMRSPVDGYVLDLSQSTVGGVVGAGEMVMNIVPADAPLIITARIKPADIADVNIGMTAQVSDVVLETRSLRQAVLVHGVASFFYNTCILALAVNAAVTAGG